MELDEEIMWPDEEEYLPKKWVSKIVKCTFTGNNYLVTEIRKEDGSLYRKIEQIEYTTDKNKKNGR